MALPVFASLISKMNIDTTLQKYVRGNFRISEETREMLSCQDFSERKGWRTYAKPVKKTHPPEKYSPSQKERKKESGIKRFFKKVFGGKDEEN